MAEFDRTKLTILLVDDEPDILDLLEEEFSDFGYTTLKADSGNNAVKILEEESAIDIVISDYKMPNGNGMVVLNKVQSIPEESRPYFFFVSGQADVGVDECLDSGAINFFHKPFDLEELIKEVEAEVVRRRG